MLRDGNESSSVVDYSTTTVGAAPASRESNASAGVHNVENDLQVAKAVRTILQSVGHGMDQLGNFVAHLNSFGRGEKKDESEKKE